MDFLMKQQSIVLNANSQLIQCTHTTDLLSNLRGLLHSMVIKVFIAMQGILTAKNTTELVVKNRT